MYDIFLCFHVRSTIEADVIEKTTKVIREAASVLSDKGIQVDSQLLHSAVEHQIQHALGESWHF